MLPTFLIIGTAKAATTSLYYYIGQHPDVFTSSIKEPRFFHFAERPIPTAGPGDTWSNRNTVQGWDDYRALFTEGGAAIARGEASPVYLYSPHAAINIKECLPNVKLVVVLRDPSERAYSHYLHLRRDKREPCDHFRDALSSEPSRIEMGWEWSWHYRGLGYYNAQVERYDALFSTDQLRVYLYDDVIRDPSPVVQDIFDFIGVDSSFEPDTRSRMNPGGLPKNNRLYDIVTQYNHPLRKLVRPLLPEPVRTRLLTRLQKKSLAKPTLPPEVRADLIRGYRDDIERLQGRIDRELSAWLN